MKKTICFILFAAIILSSLAVFSFAGNYSVADKGISKPKLDGKISAAEYKDAAAVKIESKSLNYYSVNAADTWYCEVQKAYVEARGSKIIGNSVIYVLPCDDGVYFGFNIADTTIGANYVRDVQWQDGFFHGDSVHVTFKANNNAVSDETFLNEDAVRFSITPCYLDMRGCDSGKRTIDIRSAITNNAKADSLYVLETTGMLNEAATADESGYCVECLVPWDMLKDSYSGLSEYKKGGKLYLNFQITDALGKTNTGTIDWAIFQVPINSKFTKIGDVIVDNDPGILILDGKNWCSFTKNSGEVITIGNGGSEESERLFTYTKLLGEENAKINLQGKVNGNVKSLKVDGEIVPQEYYKVEDNTMIIDGAFLEGLEIGDHEGSITYEKDGKDAEYKFIFGVDTFENPIDYDGDTMIVLAILSLSIIGFGLVMKKKKSL